MTTTNVCPKCNAKLIWRANCCEQAVQICEKHIWIDGTCDYVSDQVDQQVVFDLVNEQTTQLTEVKSRIEEIVILRLNDMDVFKYQLTREGERIAELTAKLNIEHSKYLGACDDIDELTEDKNELGIALDKSTLAGYKHIAECRTLGIRAKIAERTLSWVVRCVKGFVPKLSLRAEGSRTRYSKSNVTPDTLRDAANLYYAMVEYAIVEAEIKETE